jgi:hypothetical protein
MKTAPPVVLTIPCPKCKGALRRRAHTETLQCLNRECRNRIEVHEVRVPCPAEGCELRAYVRSDLFVQGRWIQLDRKREVFECLVGLVCPDFHHTTIQCPDALRPERTIRQPSKRGF